MRHLVAITTKLLVWYRESTQYFYPEMKTDKKVSGKFLFSTLKVPCFKHKAAVSNTSTSYPISLEKDKC